MNWQSGQVTLNQPLQLMNSVPFLGHVGGGAITSALGPHREVPQRSFGCLSSLALRC